MILCLALVTSYLSQRRSTGNRVKNYVKRAAPSNGQKRNHIGDLYEVKVRRALVSWEILCKLHGLSLQA
jgi:hypothetical protein